MMLNIHKSHPPRSFLFHKAFRFYIFHCIAILLFLYSFHNFLGSFSGFLKIIAPGVEHDFSASGVRLLQPGPCVGHSPF